jgi:hypothetical protein
MPSFGCAPDAAFAPLRKVAEERLWLPVAPPGPYASGWLRLVITFRCVR